MSRAKFLILFLFIVILAGVAFINRQEQKKDVDTSVNNPNVGLLEETEDIKIIAENLEIPWEIAFSHPNGEILITERPGNLVLVNGREKIPVGGVAHEGEGGLLGLALHPDFLNNRWIYVYFTTRQGDTLTNRVERYKFEGNKISDRTVIIQAIPGASNHNGGRIKFGPDGYLYITTGDAQNSQSAQDINSLNGKILRLKDDGSIPTDNPFGNAVYSYGHRNPQGLAWDDSGRLWATEHGRSGIQSGLDELNLIEKGKNYGWPVIEGDEKREGIVSPVIQSGPTTTWAPSGAVFYSGSIFFGGLRGEALFEYNIADKSLKKHFEGKYGRIRTVVLGPDNFLYIATSNRDGRGDVQTGDDKLIKIAPKLL